VAAAGSENFVFGCRSASERENKNPKSALELNVLTAKIKPPAQPLLPAPLGLYLASVGTRRLF